MTPSTFATQLMEMSQPIHDLTDHRERQNQIMQGAFPNKTITIHRYSNPGYQLGAIFAMYEAMRQRWFDDYDWVIRLNPDVFIRRPAQLLEMMNDDEVDGIFIDCRARMRARKSSLHAECAEGKNCTRFDKIHTDFFAFRPKAMINATFAPLVKYNTTINAELSITDYFRDHVVRYGRDRWLFDSFPGSARCRAGYQKQNPSVLHYRANQKMLNKQVLDCVNHFGSPN